MNPEPQQEHRFLTQLAGEWTFEAESIMGPDQPPMKSSGYENVRSIGSLWIVGEGGGEMPGAGSCITMLTLGYDPAKKRFVGSWVGSMMANLWVYEGTLDASGNVLTLDTEGPSFAGDGTTSKYQDIHEIKSADYRILHSQVLGEDGKWNRFMTAHYRRK
jgi:hypothetical protein